MPKTVIIPLSISLAVLAALILKLFFKIVGVVCKIVELDGMRPVKQNVEIIMKYL